MSSAFAVPRDVAVPTARRTGRAVYAVRQDDGSFRRVTITANVVTHAWLRCARRCGWRAKVPLGGLGTVAAGGELTLCPACAGRGTPSARRAIAAGHAGITVERLVTR